MRAAVKGGNKATATQLQPNPAPCRHHVLASWPGRGPLPPCSMRTRLTPPPLHLPPSPSSAPSVSEPVAAAAAAVRAAGARERPPTAAALTAPWMPEMPPGYVSAASAGRKSGSTFA
jgi:hypothetical protein